MASEHSPETIEEARRLFAGPCDFMLGVVKMDTLPDEACAEVAFAGRSNVGKSSLLNALTGRSNLARASNTPGRTREINYFDLGGVVRLVDLPGYGYARAARGDVEAWTRLTRDFLRGRAALRRVFVLVDARHGLKQTDIEVMNLLDTSAVSYAIVLTKADKVKPTALEALKEATAKAISRRPAAHPTVRATSSETGEGLPALRADIAALARE
ncbi:MAG TPA: ribosome biogenesis GTP-binding protein YihA/YsxC [Parvularculaceae bacterium]|nr:YihA family ribosome biogenesis GTP-binding protein [Amphiplicatus sp.]MCB9955072.1 YihA family ribosome biogenesis GTP-binding protein [Caulobacterales bacterium]HPE31955.1 ribosome biogenesis GTP-binding protein YihA/YsxC [Parvularculaceae bacterium]HRX40905.1 ribosome biogenesis GTP-binding protein YihA/YsxC [Parvularculaceae bacterium]